MGDQSEERDGRAAAAGHPFLDHVPVPAPAAGAAAIFKLDSTWEWRIASVRATLTTSAAVANRFPFLRVQDAEGTTWYETLAQPAIVAGGAAIVVDFTREGIVAGAGAAVQAQGGVPSVWIPGGWQIAVGALGMDVADQLSVVRLLVHKRNSI
jgi:hypothetical protein